MRSRRRDAVLSWRVWAMRVSSMGFERVCVGGGGMVKAKVKVKVVERLAAERVLC